MKTSIHRFIAANSFDSILLEDESANLILTSPPYPMIEMWDTLYSRYDHRIPDLLNGNTANGPAAFKAMHELIDGTWKECYRILKEGGFACINIGDATRSINGQFRMYSNHSRIIQAMEALDFHTLPSIIWRKTTNAPNKFMGSGMLPAGAYVTLEHEHILVFRKGGKRKFSLDAKENRSESAIFWEERNQWFSDQWDLSGTRQSLGFKAERSRSAAFPLELALRIVAMYSVSGDLVVDPFSGTGTTNAAAIILGRNSVGIDNDADLLQASCRYFTKHGTKDALNKVITERLKTHLKYVFSKDELFFRYQNKRHAFPVKTQQEKKLLIRLIKALKRNDECVIADYKKLSKKQFETCLDEVRA